MNYIPRGLERKFKQMNAFFKVMLVTGAKACAALTAEQVNYATLAAAAEKTLTFGIFCGIIIL